MLAVIGLVLSLQERIWEYEGSQVNFATVVDHVRTSGLPENVVVLSEDIPSTARPELHIKTNVFSKVIAGLAASTPIRYIRRDADGKANWYLSWTDGKPPKGAVRFYSENNAFRLQATEVTFQQIAEAMQKATGYDVVADLVNAGIDPAVPLKSFETGPRKTIGAEPIDKFVARMIEEYKETLKPAAPAPAPPATKRSVWTLTFLPGNLPAAGGQSNVNFAELRSPADSVASALNIAFASRVPDKPGDTPKTPKLMVKAIGNSLVLEGEEADVDEARRMLATQIDISQSQILLELDTYQVSANVKSREFADRSVQRLLLGQEIARAYKFAHLTAIGKTVLDIRQCILDEIQKRSDATKIQVETLMNRVGFEPAAKRSMSMSEMLLFLAYSPSKQLKETYAKYLADEFKATSESLKQRLIDPMSKSKSPLEHNIAEQLCELNSQLGGQPASIKTSSMLGHFATDGDLENDVTRGSMEDFMLLWLATADKDLSDLLKMAEREKAKQPSSVQPLQGQANIVRAKTEPGQTYTSWLQNAGLISGSNPRLDTLLSGDRAAKLVRAGARMDDLMQRGILALHEDSAALIDSPLQSWIDATVLTKSQNSSFGVRYGGTTKLAVTSRVPGVTGAVSETYFPFQPVSPIGLDSLLPMLKRPSAAEAAARAAEAANKANETTPTAPLPDKYAAAGLTPAETIILQGIFDQANKQPYHRKLATGLNFSVLPTMLSNGSTARLQVRLSLSVTPDEGTNKSGPGSLELPGPTDLLKSTVVETELLANAFDITHVSSLKLDVSAPGKRDWEFPILSQILPIRSWFVGPTQDKTVRHEAIVLVKVTILPRAMDLASRYLDSN